ncbi:BspA family leucine-rich repeat surface protein [Chryseobacterium foetidum]|uniref:BspA family leucine-rich repeat surface protein n=1 Tax=Chryseobacterium foetidum TaxID=2951057 RepID=UPI0021C59192|nr:BspA family leucine-rich repeat surface protein [Chryseobacterium foetidum]
MKKSIFTLIITLLCFFPKAQNEFITTWKPSNNHYILPNNPPFPSSATQAWAPFRGTDFTIYWEEVGYPAHNSTLNNVTSQYQVLLDFGTPFNPVPDNATYTVKVSNGNGNFHRVAFRESDLGNSLSSGMGDFSKIVEINNWGTAVWSSMHNAFNGCLYLNMIATDSPNLSMVTDMSYMFSGCSSMTGTNSINNWDTSTVTTLQGTFTSCMLFNQPIGNWNTSNVESMGAMFLMCQNFNQPIGNWDTSKVTAMDAMFNNARTFNQPIGNWNVASVDEMEFMFSNAWAFNQPIGNWNTSGVWQMNYMFLNAKAFNQPIGSWDTSSATAMHGMFQNATVFNQPIGNWNTSNVTTMNTMFQNASAFNQNIGSWNTSQVTTMQNMFTGAAGFNQSLGNWNLSSLLYASGMFQNSGLNCQNYDSTLYGWSQNPATPNNINISSASPMIYTHPAAVIARNYLISNKSWTITGDSYDDKCMSALSTHENILEGDFGFYPNPASDFIYFKNLKNGVSYRIFDSSGRLVLENVLEKNQIDIRNLAKGNYIIQIVSKNTVKSLKIVKN